MLFFTGYKGVPKYQGDNNLLAKDSDIRDSERILGTTCQNKFSSKYQL
jgi:hypothetical protein